MIMSLVPSLFMAVDAPLFSQGLKGQNSRTHAIVLSKKTELKITDSIITIVLSFQEHPVLERQKKMLLSGSFSNKRTCHLPGLHLLRYEKSQGSWGIIK